MWKEQLMNTGQERRRSRRAWINDRDAGRGRWHNNNRDVQSLSCGAYIFVNERPASRRLLLLRRPLGEASRWERGCSWRHPTDVITRLCVLSGVFTACNNVRHGTADRQSTRPRRDRTSDLYSNAARQQTDAFRSSLGNNSRCCHVNENTRWRRTLVAMHHIAVLRHAAAAARRPPTHRRPLPTRRDYRQRSPRQWTLFTRSSVCRVHHVRC